MSFALKTPDAQARWFDRDTPTIHGTH